MLFNSPEFLVFLPIVFGLYWFVTHRHLRAQNLLLLVASYIFYGWWDWRFLGLIALSTLVDYFVGIRIEEADDRQRKKRWLWVSLAVNLGILAYFKYANFFIENWITAWDTLGVTMHASTLQIILPVGISFYTFQSQHNSFSKWRPPFEILIAGSLIEFQGISPTASDAIRPIAHPIANFCRDLAEQPRRMPLHPL